VEWGKIYGNPSCNPESQILTINTPQGPVVHLSVLGKSFIILNTSEAALDILDKKGAIYASRPRLVMAGEM
jgi:predicted small integral membrane protein